jgi:hypothetical protein
LKSEDWKNLRAAVLHRDDNKCVRCKKESTANDVHHLQYRNLWDVKPSDLITLCRKCHELAHEVAEKLEVKTHNPMHKWRLVAMRLGIPDNVNTPLYGPRKAERKAESKCRKADKLLRRTFDVWGWGYCATSGQSNPTIPHSAHRVNPVSCINPTVIPPTPLRSFPWIWYREGDDTTHRV